MARSPWRGSMRAGQEDREGRGPCTPATWRPPPAQELCVLLFLGGGHFLGGRLRGPNGPFVLRPERRLLFPPLVPLRGLDSEGNEGTGRCEGPASRPPAVGGGLFWKLLSVRALVGGHTWVPSGCACGFIPRQLHAAWGGHPDKGEWGPCPVPPGGAGGGSRLRDPRGENSSASV